MSKTSVPSAVSFLSAPNIAVIGTVGRDGQPHTAATWYLWEGERALVNMDATRVRLGHMRRDPHVSLTVVGRDDPYRQVTFDRTGGRDPR